MENNIVNWITGRSDLKQVPLQELKAIVQQYPYFTLAQLLLTVKMKRDNDPEYPHQLQKTALNFQNPQWLHFQLESLDLELSSVETPIATDDEVTVSEQITHTPSFTEEEKSKEEDIHTDIDVEAENISFQNEPMHIADILKENDFVEQTEINNTTIEEQTEEEQSDKEEEISHAETNFVDANNNLSLEEDQNEHFESSITNDNQGDLPTEIENIPSETKEQSEYIDDSEKEIKGEPFEPVVSDENSLENNIETLPTPEIQSDNTETIPNEKDHAVEDIEHKDEQALLETSNAIATDQDQQDYSAETEQQEENIELTQPAESAEGLSSDRLSAMLEAQAQAFKSDDVSKEELTYENPVLLPTKDYFASIGITTDNSINTDFGQKVKRFSDWLKQMKKIDKADLGKNSDPNEEIMISQKAHDSNKPSDIVTETMAEVLIQQGKNTEAIETLEKLSLLKPEKSAYFASLINNLKNNI